MDPRPGLRVHARGLTWDVLEVDRAGSRQRLSVRCAEGDMTGQEWDLYVPPEQVELIDAALDPCCPAPFPMWHLMHRAHVLDEIPLGASFVAREPGRIQVEPYQLVPLMRALDMTRPRLLLADGVGLGKTIQAGLIAAELIARRRAHRILIVVPSGPLLFQWEQETRLRFGLAFTLLTNAAELRDIRHAHELGSNPFDSVSLCITSLDFAKQDHILEELERSAWDLVIIDEAHHCAGLGPHVSRDSTQRRRLAEVLAGRSDGLLLLTATPHDGHDAHFASLIALLDPSLVDGAGGLAGHEYRRHVIRRMKIHIRDPATGAPLFKRRQVLPVKVDVHGAEQEVVRDFHLALSAFVVPRLKRRAGGDDSLAFVSLLKRSVSTISACLKTLRVVSDRLARDGEDGVESKSERRERARALRAFRRRVSRFGGLGASDEANQEVLEVESMAESLRTEPDHELERLIQAGVAAEAYDPKLAAMVLEVRLIRIMHPRANILIYTEYIDSQIAAARALRSARGVEGDILTIGGQDDDAVRAAMATRFTDADSLILISTDSLAEGLNLHRHCFHLIHLDLPYNPNRLEQRNGRIDRYGQQHEPEIRYLYIPGTFEESLLLHLIIKYEKARSFLDVMPDTLGVTANLDGDAGSLTGRLSENPADLFRADTDTIRSLDRAVEASNPEAIATLMREIDRAFDAFDLMAVSHGWYGARGFDAGMKPALRPLIKDAEDLPGFVGAVIEAETSEHALTNDSICLPTAWARDLDGLPGFNSPHSSLRFTRDVDVFSDQSGRPLGFLGRAHPLVLRAIKHGCRLPGAVSVHIGDHLGLLLTFELEIRSTSRTMFREVIAVMVRSDVPPVELSHWLAPTVAGLTPVTAGVWDRLFASWTGPSHQSTEELVSRISGLRYDEFVARRDSLKDEQTMRNRHCLQVRANLLCGSFVRRTGDLFGEPEQGPSWRYQEDPLTRLISFATDPSTPRSKRGEANDAIEMFRTVTHSGDAPGSVVSRPIGMLMMVPRNAL